MSRGDGTGRLVSAPDADDSGATILHVDMDAFFVSVEVLDDPTLEGKPVIIGSRHPRSVVSSASYQARRFGVRSAMPVSEALRLCPRALVVPPTFDRYREMSHRVMTMFREFTPAVEPLSIDEAFLDVRGARRLWGSPRVIADLLRRRVRDELGLPCSVGGASTKHVAKMASTLAKPNGVLIIAERETEAFLGPRPVSAVWGIGPKSAQSLTSRGIHTVADVRATPTAVLERLLGHAGAQRLLELAHGIDPREVEDMRIEKSVGHEETFSRDIADDRVLRAEVRRLADRVGARLRRSGWEAATVALKLRFADFHTVNRSRTLAEPTAVSQRLGDAALDLFDAVDRPLPIRLIGVRGERLQKAGGAAPTLWDEDAHWRHIDNAIDDLADRFGSSAVTRGTLLRPDRPDPSDPG